MHLATAQALAWQLLQKHGLMQIGWSFQFDNAKRRFGVCKHGLKVIQLSEDLTAMNEVEKVTDVILHEIAHALCDRGEGHGRAWKQKCIEIGAKPERCYSEADTVTTKGNWKGVCPNGHESKRFKTPKRKLSCGKCCRSFNEKYLITWTKI